MVKWDNLYEISLSIRDLWMNYDHCFWTDAEGYGWQYQRWRVKQGTHTAGPSGTLTGRGEIQRQDPSQVCEPCCPLHSNSTEESSRAKRQALEEKPQSFGYRALKKKNLHDWQSTSCSHGVIKGWGPNPWSQQYDVAEPWPPFLGHHLST